LRVWQEGETLHLDNDGGKLNRADSITVIQDRLTLSENSRKSFLESCESAFHFGKGKIAIIPLRSNLEPGTRNPELRFSSHLHCAACDLSYREATPSLFSF